MRPEDPSDTDKIAAGVLLSIHLAGYDYPIRRLRRHSDTNCVTLPLQVRGFLALERGDWLAFGATPWPGVAAFLVVTAKQAQALTAAGLKEFRKLARKVQGGHGLVFVNIPPRICEILSAEIGDFLYFGRAPQRRIINICVIKGGGESAGSRRDR
ncbi:hypothetical protein ES703_71560 [subsurface metagenome]